MIIFVSIIGMHYLNVILKIIHRDLKGTNIFLTRKSDRSFVKIADFGHALHESKENSRKFRYNCFNFGTLQFMVIC